MRSLVLRNPGASNSACGSRNRTGLVIRLVDRLAARSWRRSARPSSAASSSMSSWPATRT